MKDIHKDYAPVKVLERVEREMVEKVVERRVVGKLVVGMGEDGKEVERMVGKGWSLEWGRVAAREGRIWERGEGGRERVSRVMFWVRAKRAQKGGVSVVGRRGI